VAERAISLTRERCVREHRPTVVDVGTGTGAIALAVAAEAPDARIYATESSALARGWALRNLAATGLRVTLLPGELLAPLHPALGGNCDLIVANLPYLSEDEWNQAEPEVRRYEPREALVGGPTGLEPIVDLIEQAEHWLAHAGWLLLEIGDTQGAEVSRFMKARGYREIQVRKDLAGRDRMVEGRWTMLL
ncbi:MAG: N5-glutamine methyltransferase family protein, partial [Actinomycetota bacterium]